MTNSPAVCPTCRDTGYFGDIGPGWHDNHEVMECFCDPVARANRVLAKKNSCKADSVVK